MYKDSKFLSEIGKYFHKNGRESAMGTIWSMMHNVKFVYRSLFYGIEVKPNCLFTPILILQCLIMFPIFGVGNPSRFPSSSLYNYLSAKKDVFYGFLNNGRINWRKIMWNISCQIWNRIVLRSDHTRQTLPTVLIFDDTDVKKTSRRMELISKIYSHVDHGYHYGFKALFCCISDGASHLLLDMALLRESKGKNFGLTKKQEQEMHTREDADGTPAAERKAESVKSKIELMKEMIRRAVDHHIKFKYVLNDSWFTCEEIVKFVRGMHNGCHYLGMIKMGNRNYLYNGKMYTAKELAKHIWSKGCGYRHRKFGYSYVFANVRMGNEKVRIFLSRRSKKDGWKGYVTTNLGMSFEDAFKIYSMRWAIEVVNKEEKSLLHMDKCQSWFYAAQVAYITITSLQYNFLAMAKRFSDYETIGGLFRGTEDDVAEMTLTEKIMEIMMDFAETAIEEFGFSGNIIIDIIYKTDKLKRFVNLFQKLVV